MRTTLTAAFLIAVVFGSLYMDMESGGFPTADGIQIFALILIAIVAYFLPTIIAFSRGHQSAAAILAVNLLAGWAGLASPPCDSLATEGRGGANGRGGTRRRKSGQGSQSEARRARLASRRRDRTGVCAKADHRRRKGGCCRWKASIANYRRRRELASAPRSNGAASAARSFQPSDANGRPG